VLASELGLAAPFRVAPVAVTSVAGDVLTDGGAVVVNDSTTPTLVPAALEAIAQ
jgi:hypothetical protein